MLSEWPQTMCQEYVYNISNKVTKKL